MNSTALLPTAADTLRLGSVLARSCPWERTGTRVVFLLGDLGAGKTTLAAATLEALGAAEIVRSPSYTLIETYQLPAGLALHLDCYRLRDASELEQLGLRDYLGERTLWLIEWPEHVAGALPDFDLSIHLKFADEGRLAEIRAHGAAGQAWLSSAKGLIRSQS